MKLAALRPRLAVALWLLTLVASLAVIAQTRFTADMSAFLPKNPTASQELLVDQLKEGVLSRTLLLGIEGADAPTRAALSRALAPRLQAGGHFVSVQNGAAAATEQDRKLLFGQRYLLSPAVTPQRFSVDGLHAAIGSSIDLLGSPAGMLIKNLLPHDPTGEMVELFSAFDGDSAPASQSGAWASRDGRRALLMVQTRAAGSDTDGQQQAIAAIHAAFEAAKADAAGQSHQQPKREFLPFQGGGQEGDGVASEKNAPHAALTPHPHPGPPLEGEGEHVQGIAVHDDARLLISGAPVFAVDARATIEREVKRLSIISAVGIVVLLLLAYRSVTTLLFGLLPVLSGALAGIAAVSLGYGSVHGITIGFGTTLIGEAVDYTIYYFIQSGDDDSAQRDARWIERFWPTIRLGVLTSVCGFASLLFSGFPGLAQLGLYSIAGLVTAAAVTRFVLPHLRPAGVQVRRFGQGRIGRLATRLLLRLNTLQRGRWAVILLALLAIGIIAKRHDQLWSDSLSGLSPVSPALQQLDMSLRADLGAPDLRYLVVVSRNAPLVRPHEVSTSVRAEPVEAQRPSTGSGGTEFEHLQAGNADGREAALAAAEQAGAVLDRLVATGAIASYNSAARFLPSRATQQRRRDALPERAELARRLTLATQDLPLRAEKLTPFLDDVAAARQQPLLDRAQLQGSSLALAVDSLLMQRQVHGANQWTALLPLRAVSGGEIDPARIQQALTEAHVDGALCLDLANESTRLYQAYLHEAILLSLAGFGAIALLLSWALRSPRRALHVLTPLAAAVLLVIAGLALTGEKLTLLHLIGLLLIVAVGSNYALFFDRSSEHPAGHAAADAQTLVSLLLANIATLIGFGTLAFAQVPVLHAIGVTVGPGALLALLLSAMLAGPASPQQA